MDQYEGNDVKVKSMSGDYRYQMEDYYMRYPIGVQDFGSIIEGNYTYVDKTALIFELAKQHICFLSRPRRFGKSLLISTLDAYFSGKKELFKDLAIDSLEKDWVEYPVFRIDYAIGDYTREALKLRVFIKKRPFI